MYKCRTNTRIILANAQEDLNSFILRMFECTISLDKALITINLLFIITKTRLYNFDPLKSHFYIVKLGFTGVSIIFLFLHKNIDCGYSLKPPRRGGSNEYPQSMF